jgi:hypothetical protein
VTKKRRKKDFKKMIKISPKRKKKCNQKKSLKKGNNHKQIAM